MQFIPDVLCQKRSASENEILFWTWTTDLLLEESGLWLEKYTRIRSKPFRLIGAASSEQYSK